MLTRLLYLWLFVLLLSLSCSATSWAQSPSEIGLRTVRFIPQWSPQAQFAGYYAAQDMGFYAQRGLEVEILPGGANHPSGPALAAGEADFASMFLSRGLILRSQGHPVVNVAQIAQRSGLMLVAKKDSGIDVPQDLEGKTVSLWPEFKAQPKAFFHKFDLKVNTIRQGYSMDLFLMGGVDAASAMAYNEYLTIINSGVNKDELTTFSMADYDLNFPEDGIYCQESLLRDDPDLVRDFVQASIQGWEYAFSHPEQALDMVMQRVKKARLPTNRVHQEGMLHGMRDIIQPEDAAGHIGWMDRQTYEFVTSKLTEYGALSFTEPFEVFYDPRPSAE
ncbi:MAG: ABC transporter substrate-binding protein [Desulfovermiculus sp.]